MPYKDKGKDRQWHRNKMRQKRGVTPELLHPVTPLEAIKPKPDIGQGSNITGFFTVPLYNPAIHKAGDRVLVWRGNHLVETIIPELDADGQPIRW